MNTCLLVVAYDPYRAMCWEGWIGSYRRHWGHEGRDGWPLYWANQEAALEFPEARQLLTGEGQWTDRLLRAVERIEEEYVLAVMEDMWIRESLPGEFLEGVVSLMREHAIQCFGLHPDSEHYRTTLQPVMVPGDELGRTVWRFEEASDYTTSTQPTIWERRTLLELLRLCPGMSPWDWEIKGTQVWRESGTYRSGRWFVPLVWYAHVVRQGQLRPEGKAILEELRREVRPCPSSA